MSNLELAGTPGTVVARGRNKGVNCPLAIDLDIDTPLEIEGPKSRNWMIIVQNLEDKTWNDVDQFLKNIPGIKEYGGQPERGAATGHLHAQCWAVTHNPVRGGSLTGTGLSVWRRRADNIYAVKNYSVKRYTRDYSMPAWSSSKSILCTNPTPKGWTHLSLLPWQTTILEILRGPTDDRTILWVWSRVGKTGKSCFANYLRINFLDSMYIPVSNGNDIRSIVTPTYNIYIFDFARGMYHLEGPCIVMEQMKNGGFYKSKLQKDPKFIEFDHNIHIVVFCNYPPNYDDLSACRIREFELTEQLNGGSETHVK